MPEASEWRDRTRRQEPRGRVSTDIQRPAVVCRAQGPEFGQVPEDVDEPREDVRDTSRGAPGVLGFRKEDEGRVSALPHVAEPEQTEVIRNSWREL